MSRLTTAVLAGVLAAAALCCLGGGMQAKIWPRDAEERKSLEAAGWGNRLNTRFRSLDLARGQLVRVTQETWTAPWSYYLTAPTAHFRRPLVRAFVDWALEEARAGT